MFKYKNKVIFVVFYIYKVIQVTHTILIKLYTFLIT